MARFQFNPVLLSVVVAASLTVAYAEPPGQSPPEPGVASDQPPPMTAGQQRARELWTTLNDADKAFVREFVAANDLALLSPDLLSLRAQGKNEQAIKMLAKDCNLHDPARAEIILKLLAYAHEQQ